MLSMLDAKLTNELVSQLPWNLARIRCLSILLISILANHTVNMVILATEAPEDIKAESLYRRFQNFFLKFDMPLLDIGRLVVSKIPKPKNGWVLSMDRTNWKFGRTHINILVVGIVVNKVAFPIAWRVLPQLTKRGNSRTCHRKSILRKVLSSISAHDIRVLTMDREFDGKDWLQWLDKQGVKFILRIKNNVLVDGNKAGEATHSQQLNRSELREIWGLKLYFSGCKITGKNTRDPYLYVISNFYHGPEARNLYRLRWGIEQLFSHLKKRGFDLETTHIAGGRKIEKLFAVLVLAFLISYGWGCELKANHSDTPLNATQQRKSTFRLGLDVITRFLAQRSIFEADIEQILVWFRLPKYQSIFIV